MAISAKHRSKFENLHCQWRRLQVSEKLSSGTKNSKQTNKNPRQTVIVIVDHFILSVHKIYALQVYNRKNIFKEIQHLHKF